MKRLVILVYGILCYAIFFLTFLYLIAFLGNLQQVPLLTAWLPWLAEVVPYSVDAGRETGNPGVAVIINLALILIFGLQHSVMARTGFKRWLKQAVPESAERSTYVLVSSACLILLYWQWRSLPGVIWSAESAAAQAVGWGLFGLGFAIVLLSTFLINHFDLFGLRQVWNQFRERPNNPVPFVTPLLYAVVRHPLYLGFLLAFWGGPTMTVGGLIFAGGMTVYILIAVRFEERDLVRFHGNEYRRYQEQVPMLVPLPGHRYRPLGSHGERVSG